MAAGALSPSLAPAEPPQAGGLDCGADILRCLARSRAAEGGVSVLRLATLTGRHRSLVRRVVEDLLALGLVEHLPRTRRLRLGWKLYATAARAMETRMSTRSRPILERLASEWGEAAYLVVRRGTHAVTVAEATAATAVQVVSWVGRSYPVARSDAGPVLLADLSSDAVRELLGAGRLPPSRAQRAPRTLGGLLRLVETARRSGVSVLVEQAEPGVSSAAAPVRDFRGELVAAVVVSGPTDRLHPRLAPLAEAVVAAARELSDLLSSPAPAAHPGPVRSGAR